MIVKSRVCRNPRAVTYSKKVLLSRCQVLYNLELNILIMKRFIVSFPLRIIPCIFIIYSVVIISIVYVILGFGSVVV